MFYQLRTIISSDMAAQRHREREANRRRAAGAIDRDAYLSLAISKRDQALALRARGLSVRAIAQQLQISKSLAGLYTKNSS